jgi:hypothetical protein
MDDLEVTGTPIFDKTSVEFCEAQHGRPALKYIYKLANLLVFLPLTLAKKCQKQLLKNLGGTLL